MFVKNDELNTALKRLRLDEQTLIYSEVTLDADGQTTSFLVGGIPDIYNIEDFEQYHEFAQNLQANTAICVNVHSWSVGCGESERAKDEEAALIEANRDYLDKVFGIDSLQREEFTEYVRDEAYDYGEDEPDDDMEL